MRLSSGSYGSIIYLSLILTAAVAVAFIVISVDFGGLGDTYFRVGPHAGLRLAGIPVETAASYSAAFVFIGTVTAIGSVNSALIVPFLFEKVNLKPEEAVTDIGLWPLRLMYFANSVSVNIRRIFTTLIIVSQIDFALLSFGVRVFCETVIVLYLTRQKIVPGPTPAAGYKAMEMYPVRGR